MCPAHLDQELLIGGRSGRTHRIRRPKNAKVVDASLRRGFRNNGLIEIDNKSDQEDEVGFDDGTIFRVTERSIKLDFIDRIKRYVSIILVNTHVCLLYTRANAEQAHKQEAQRRLEEEEAARRARVEAERQAAFNARDLIEQQAALTLVQLAEKNTDLGIESDSMQALINTLIVSTFLFYYLILIYIGTILRIIYSFTNQVAKFEQGEAPAKVIAMCASDNAEEPTGGTGGAGATSPGASASVNNAKKATTQPMAAKSGAPSAEERQQLLMLQELIRRRLAEADVVEENHE